MASKAIYTVVAVAGIAAASGAAWWYQKPKTPAGAGDVSSSAAGPTKIAASDAANGKPVTVEAARVELARLVDDAQAVGSLRSRRGVVLRPEVSGRITQLNFTDGQRVRKGQVLVQFDDQLQLAQVQQSQAELSIARANQKRNEELVAQNFVSQRSLDESAANLQVAEAKLSLAKATAARLKIVAPFDGIAGIRLVNVGDYLKDGADIVNIEDIEAIYVDFRLPERFHSKVRRDQTAVLDIDALPGRSYSAQIQAIDPLIDANGRSVGIRGCIDNRQLQLRPGMFARVNTVFGVRDNARVIPEEAIVPQGGKQFVIKLLEGPNGQTRKSQRVEVKVGLRTPGKVEILQGLEADDLIVATGQQRVQRDGTLVTVVDLSSARPASPAKAAGNGSANAAAPAEPALSGANPCGVVISQAPAVDKTGRGAGTPERSPAATTARNPA
ncbi:efflux RND transporter periplasmic adaptor subunit [Polaromonas sp. SM01]|uniref:efflux RND transporter periplasmic adaptor subunit n=1 Tax=Polaromonas sp. SM01 TaxID=3085630 RepID=UPI002981F39B|nr:efflux RND transporter periplasmic adaptor subunit [Polaromonas sp. SM01]MDW5444968.1 efflux RND transporter periplasmic adaptor subunit [Polaromonas sp. SM01]